MVKKASEMKRMSSDALVDLGSRVSERVQIQDVHLVETRAKRGSLRKGQPLHLHFSVNVTTHVDEPKSVVVVRPLLGLIAKYDDATDGEEALRVEAAFMLVYKMTSTAGLDKAKYDAFGNTN